MDIRPARSAVHHREQARCRWQYWDRDAGAGTADGYTLLYVVTANAISPALFDKLNFNFLRDIAPVGGITRVPNVVSVTPALPVETIPQLIAHAKANQTSVRQPQARFFSQASCST